MCFLLDIKARASGGELDGCSLVSSVSKVALSTLTYSTALVVQQGIQTKVEVFGG